jgi:alpha-amylase/alpha-mannosidase (GH57 family)
MAVNQLYTIIHGHFYQPPREDPWTWQIDRQPSAFPAHDWNERVNKECYAANAASRVLDSAGRIEDIINNYEYISFNIGPTLINWLKQKDVYTYRRIQEADLKSRQRNGGHGNAIAQVYNHIIMPLASDKDIITEIEWGLKSFRKDFGREAEGMWLSETAINSRVAKFLISYGIKFIILSPTQAKEVKSGSEWKDVSGGSIDPSKPYILEESNGTLSVFFYYGDIASKLSFQHLLRNVDSFRGELLAHNHTQKDIHLIHVATDGETYGHHEPFGDMCLSRLLYENQFRNEFIFTNYAHFLEIFPVKDFVRLKDGNEGYGTAWSCSHGVDRWRKDCGDSTGAPEGWNQKWREGLRNAFDFLRDRLSEAAEKEVSGLISDIWEARNNYYDVVNAASLEERTMALDRFFEKYMKKNSTASEKSFVVRMMEALSNELLMYTSCGWFFSEISGIETVQDLKYAAWIFHLVGDVLPQDTKKKFLEALSHAKSNIPEFQNGKWIFENKVEKAIFTEGNTASEYLLSRLLSTENISIHKTEKYFYYWISILEYNAQQKEEYWIHKFKIRMSNNLLMQEGDYICYVIRSGIRFHSFVKKVVDESLIHYLDKMVEKDNPKMILQDFNDWFNKSYSLYDLSADSREFVLRNIFEKAMGNLHKKAGSKLVDVDEYLDAISIYKDLGVVLPEKDVVAIQELLNNYIINELERIPEVSIESYDFTKLIKTIQTVKKADLHIDYADILPLIRNYVLDRMHQAVMELDTQELKNLEKLIDFTNVAGIDFEKYEIQNILYERLSFFKEQPSHSAANKESIQALLRLALKFNISIRSFEDTLKIS